METVLCNITPAMAKRWLESNNTLNRNIRPRLITKYAADMKAGAWHISHQGIAFYDDGSLADGQHRLQAIVTSNCTVQMLVSRGLPRQSGRAVDLHAARQAHDALRLGGAPEWINKDVVAIIRFMKSKGAGSIALSIDQMESYALRYEQEIRFAADLNRPTKRGITGAPLGACYVAALLSGEPAEMLTRFATIMRTGECTSAEDNAALRLREYLIFNPISWHGAGAAARSAKRAQRAIKAFCERTPLAKLYEPAEFIYPFPEMDL